LNLTMIRQLRAVYDEWVHGKETAIKCIVMEGNGGKVRGRAFFTESPHLPMPFVERCALPLRSAPLASAGPLFGQCSTTATPTTAAGAPAATFRMQTRTNRANLLLGGTKPQAFCAGGDVAAVQIASIAGESLPQDFFYEE
jgi:hypothetical protein